jgi:hypothetical protein
MWEFAATTQFLYLFYDMFGLDEFDVEVNIPFNPLIWLTPHSRYLDLCFEDMC